MRLALSLTLLSAAACGAPPIQENRAPVAVLGEVGTLRDGLVELDAAASYDPDGDPIVCHWDITSGPASGAVSFLDNHSFEACRTALRAPVAGTYVVGLTLSDGSALTDRAFVVVVSDSELGAPVIQAMLSQVDGQVTLDASRSFDPLGGTLSFRWELASTPYGSRVETDDLSDPSAAITTFEADAAGSYIAQLTVSNELDRTTTYVNGVVTLDNTAPVADAGPDREVTVCEPATLDGSASFDAEGDRLRVGWQVQDTPEGSVLTDEDLDIDAFERTASVTPDVLGDFTFLASAHDGASWSSPDAVTLTAVPVEDNAPPEVSLSATEVVVTDRVGCACTTGRFGEVCTCDARCGEAVAPVTVEATVSDPDGHDVSWRWVARDDGRIVGSEEDGPLVAVVPTVGFTAIGTVRETHTFELVATDCPGDDTRASAQVTLECEFYRK